MADKLRWQRVSVRRGTPPAYHFWRRAYVSACGRFQVVEEMGGPWGSTWYAYDLKTGCTAT